MVMFCEKVLRRLGGNYTFVIVTDRTELDDQIAGQFASVGALTKDIHQAQAGSRAHLRELLEGNERYVFSLIQKFSTADREPMPVLSERSDIIVITDEAHRSQYAARQSSWEQRDNQDENLPGWLGVGRSPEPSHPGGSIPRGEMMTAVGQVRRGFSLVEDLSCLAVTSTIIN
jgi:superfamily II DNA or RNA helicase